MKTKNIIFCCLMILPLIAVLIALQFLPQQIPVHYGFDGQVNRWGSKYELLILPGFSLVFGLIMQGMARYCARHEENGSNNQQVCILSGIVSLILFDALTGYFLYTAFRKVENLSAVALDVNQLMFVILGLALIILGNVMPKLRMNSVIGLRTGWSMQNETTWKKSQRFGGISLMVGGAVMIVACSLTHGPVCLGCGLGILALIVVIDLVYTYKIAQKYPA